MNDTKTVSGAIVHVTDADEAPLVKCLVDITPEQSGTGTPSPSNVRAISGWESVSVYVSPTEDEADGHTTTTSLGRTVYGGALDVVTGVLTVTHGIIDLGAYTWQRNSTYTNCYSIGGNSLPIPAPINACHSGLCEKYNVWYTGSDVPLSTITSSSSNGNVFISPSRWSSSNKSIVINDNRGLSADAFTNDLSGTHLVCELATPQTYTLTGQEISAMYGENYIWGSSGPVEITYRTNVLGIYNKIYIDGRPYFRPNDFQLAREDVYAGEYTSCTGKLIADKIGWKYSDLPMKWDILPDEDLVYLTTLTGAFDLIFRDSDGQHTETVIRRAFTNTPTRTTGPEGTKIWTGVEMEVSFLNTHPINE